MSGWSGGPGGSEPRSDGGWDPQRPGGTDPWGRPIQGGQPTGQGGSGQPGWQTQSTPTGQPGAGQPGGWQTQTGSQPIPGSQGRQAPPPGWGQPPAQGQVPPGWGQQPPPGYGRPPQPGQPSQLGQGGQPGQVPPGWGQQPPPGWGQPAGAPPSQGQVPGWAQPQAGAPSAWAGNQGGPPAPWGPQPPQAPGWGEQAAWGPPGGGPGPGDFPVRLFFDETQGIGRLWGLPGIGSAVRLLLLIPHLFVLILLGIAAAILMYLTWLPVLLLGRQVDLVYTIVGGYLRWTTRVTSYLYLLNSGYPPFSLSGEDDYRVRVEIDRDQAINRFWGIPLIGFLVRYLILLPHYLALFVVGIAAFVLILFAWVPVLLLGRQAELVYAVVGGYLRWALRVTTYLLLLHDRYPPFSLGNEEADRYR